MKKTIPIIVTCLALAGCESFRAPTMEQRLEGKTGAERQQELFYICLERFDDPIYGGGYSAHEYNREKLCYEMRDLAGQAGEQKNIVLAEQCRLEIEKGLHRDNPKNVKQHQNMQRVCEEMTGKPVAVKY